MPHLPPTHHETSKHDSPSETKIKEKQNETILDSNSNHANSMTHHNQTKELASKSTQYSQSYKARNHPSINQDEHSLGPPKLYIKIVQSMPSLGIRRMQHNIGIFAITYPFLVPPHLLCRFFTQEQPFQPWRDRYVMTLFDCYFYGDRYPIFVYYLHVWTYHNAYIQCRPCAPSRTTCNFFRRHQSSRSPFPDWTQSS
jgi:hypothetical protein